MKTGQLPALRVARTQDKITLFVNTKLIIKKNWNDQDVPRNTATSAGIRQHVASYSTKRQASEMTTSQPDDSQKKQPPYDSENRQTTRQAARADQR